MKDKNLYMNLYVNDKTFELIDMQFGVPQVSILGPALFKMTQPSLSTAVHPFRSGPYHWRIE